MIEHAIRQFFVKEAVPPCRILAAVSGGVDSTALLLALSNLRPEGFDIVAGHVNHHLRGAESDEDEAFVGDLCARLGIRLRVADGTLDPARVRECGVEGAAREIRYARLAAIRDEEEARHVATAHQKNDQAETVLMRLATGSGIAGLRGIHPLRDDGVVRPLLGVTRDEIEAFLRERGVVPRIDRSNADPRFVRNRVRMLLPDLGTLDALSAIAENARAQWPSLQRSIDEAERAGVDVRDHETRFLRWPDDPWLRGSLLLRHIRRLDPQARDFDAARIAGEIDSLKRIRVTKNLELIRKGTTLVLRKPPEPAQPFEIDLSEESPARIASLRLTVRIAGPGGPPATGKVQRIQLPPGAEGSFTVRNRRAGDRFQPLGLPVPKKLKDFLIDRKIAIDDRDRLPLLVWNGEIVWIAGVEVSERFKVTGRVVSFTKSGRRALVHPATREINPIFTAEQIADRVRSLAAEIRADAGTHEVFLLAILKGAALLLADLLRAMPGEVSYSFIDVVRDRADNEIADALEIDFLNFTDIRGRHVYVLKDVVATGVIENYLLTQLRAREPATLRLVALLDRANARTVDLTADFHAFPIEDDGTWVGYGLESRRRFGNLPYIGRLPSE